MSTFNIPDGLAPEIYPLAWLVGSWRGYGVLAYPSIPEQPIVQEVTFDHDGGPYLRCRSTIWTVDPARSESVAHETPGIAGAELLAPAEVWSSESSYWRPSPTQHSAQRQAGEPATDGRGAPPPITDIEVLLAQPTGHVAVYLGRAQGPRIDLVSDAMVRTAEASEVTAGRRMYGLVAGDLLWHEELAAFGNELQPYTSGRMGRKVMT
ncbi:MAG TPA: FABP family protein [Actinomycetaceae bacterium]|nr:FABP family protein [Actinomycetaceae bacterium]